jgi:hypothetical protein
MSDASAILFKFSAQLNKFGKGKQLRDGLSVAVQIEDTLWTANDETVSLERFTLTKSEHSDEYERAENHEQFLLHDYLKMPLKSDPKKLKEADIEGLAYDGKYLWLVGSHSLKRKKPKLKNGPAKARDKLAKVDADGNRFLLARIPVAVKDGTHVLEKSRSVDGETRIAATLRGDENGNELTEALKRDEHLEHFLKIPGKDNGFDIEGLAIAGKRIFLGLRGPVLRGWALILEIEPEDGEPGVLSLKNIGPGGRKYLKHFLNLGGLGIRDLSVSGDDLLILSGPTMDLDGPVYISRWTEGARSAGESIIPAEDLKNILEIPFGKGEDHAEGFTLFAKDGGEPGSILVVYDAVSERRQLEDDLMVADIFDLPGL